MFPNLEGSIAAVSGAGKRGQDVVWVDRCLETVCLFGLGCGGKGQETSLLTWSKIPGMSTYSGPGEEPSPWGRLTMGTVMASTSGFLLVMQAGGRGLEDKRVAPPVVWMDCSIRNGEGAPGDIFIRVIQWLWPASRRVTRSNRLAIHLRWCPTVSSSKRIEEVSNS